MPQEKRSDPAASSAARRRRRLLLLDFILVLAKLNHPLGFCAAFPLSSVGALSAADLTFIEKEHEEAKQQKEDNDDEHNFKNLKYDHTIPSPSPPESFLDPE